MRPYQPGAVLREQGTLNPVLREGPSGTTEADTIVEKEI
jgi:hypothetical protein